MTAADPSCKDVLTHIFYIYIFWTGDTYITFNISDFTYRAPTVCLDQWSSNCGLWAGCRPWGTIHSTDNGSLFLA